MRISKNISYKNFGRAFTTDEKKSYSKLLADSKKALKIKDTTAIVFDFNVPSEKAYNTGIGTTFADSMRGFIPFVQTMSGISSIQLQPQGKISVGNKSPYSGTNFAYGEHIVDLKKLTTNEYANLLSLSDIQSASILSGEYRTDYDHVIGDGKTDGIQQKLLKKAYENFNLKLNNADEDAIRLNNEFVSFKQDNSTWLKKDALFEVLASIYETADIKNWEESDRYLFANSTPEETRKSRISELEAEYPDTIEFENFKQFIADKQQKESRETLNAQNIKLYGDCLIGFSKSEMWGNIDCFRDNLFYGGPDPNCPETNGIQTWGLPALDYTKLGECNEDGDLSKLGEVGKFLYDKYSTFFKRYDGIRMDAAWQFVTPFIYQVTNGHYEKVDLPEINFSIFNIMNAAAKNTLGEKFDKQNPDNIMLEMVGMSADSGRFLTMNMYPHLYTTAYAEYDETPKKFIEKGYKDSKFYVGVGCHDNDSLANLAKDFYKRDSHISGMKRDYNLDYSQLDYQTEDYDVQTCEQKTQENYRTAKFAEIFTTPKQFFTLPDMFGMQERINISGKESKDNWSIRIPTDYEKFYFSQLLNGFGLNMPKALAVAMGLKQIGNKELIQKCNEAAEILRSKGPLTEEEANQLDKKGELSAKFEYVS